MGVSDPETALAVRLTAQGIDPDQVEEALALHQQTGAPVEEALIDVGVPELALLEALAGVYGVQFVSSEKLARAQVHPATLRLIPFSLAQRFCAVPLLLDDDATLTAVAARPLAPGLAEDLQRSATANDVRLLVALPRAVRNAISKLYGKVAGAPSEIADTSVAPVPPTFVDSSAPSFLDASAATHRHPVRSMPAREQLAPNVEMESAKGRYRTRKKTLPSEMDFTAVGAEAAPRVEVLRAHGMETESSLPPVSLHDIQMLELNEDGSFPDASLMVSPAAAALGGASGSLSSTLPGAGASNVPPMRVPTPFDLQLERPQEGGEEPPAVSRKARPSEFDLDAASEPEELQDGLSLPPTTLPETEPLHVDDTGRPIALRLLERLVPMLEVQQGRTGHSDATWKMLERVARELDAPFSTEEVQFAGLLHDLGKDPGHFTPLSLAEDATKRDDAATQHSLPLALVAGIGLPATSVEALKHMYERVDGGGFPSSLAGAEIPQLARMLSVAESYVDLVETKDNHLGKKHNHQEALALLRKYTGSVFDEEVVDALAFAVGHDQL